MIEDAAAAAGLVDAIAPEHLQLVGVWAEQLASRVRNAGAIFLGAATPEVFGDYLAGQGATTVHVQCCGGRPHALGRSGKVQRVIAARH